MLQIASNKGFKRSERAFTLVELVILIGVLSLMAGMGLDLLSSARERSGQRVTVERQQKLRQILLAYCEATIANRLGNAPYSNEGVLTATTTNQTLAFSPSNPPLLSAFHGKGDLPEDEEDDLFRDGWGAKFRYFIPATASNASAASQATAYIVSPGTDGVLDFTSPASSANDDVVCELSFVSIFEREAAARANVINLALEKRRTDKGAILGSASDNVSAANLASVLTALRVPYDAVIFKSAPYLPTPTRDRYLTSLWSMSAEAYRPPGTAAYSIVAQVEAKQP